MRIELNLAPVPPVPIVIRGKDGKDRKIEIRPFSISDEAWLSEFLAGEDLFGMGDNNPTRAVGAFLHQLSDPGRGVFAEALGIKFSGDFRADASVVCGMLAAEEVSPIVKSLVILRERCLPELAAGQEAAASGKKMRGYAWTAMLCVCSALLAGGLTRLILLSG